MNIIDLLKKINKIIQLNSTRISKVNKTTDIIIDASDEMNVIIEKLIKNYKEFCNYQEILNIEKKDRLQILKFVWERWAYHSSGIFKDVIKTFPQYNKDDLELIVRKESGRINTYYHSQNYRKLLKTSRIFKVSLIRYYKQNHQREPVVKFCLPEDMPKIYDAWREDNGKIDRISFVLAGNHCYKENIQEIYLFIDNEEKEINAEELKEFCDKNNFQYPLEKELL